MPDLLAETRVPRSTPSVVPRLEDIASHSFILAGDIAQRLDSFSHRTDTSALAIFMSALAALLHRYTGECTVKIAAADGEEQPFSELNLLAVPVGSGQSFEALVEHVQRAVSESHPNLSELRQSPSSLGQVRFAISPEMQNELVLSPSLGSSDRARVLRIWFAREGAKLVGRVEYSKDLLDERTILRWTRHLENLLRSASENPETSISRLIILSEQERQQILFEWNSTDRGYPEGCVHELFERQVQRTPDAVALIDGDQRITYRELSRQANQLAHYLIARGAGPEVLVGLCMEQSWRAVVGIMAILKAGGAYVPLDPAYPQQRLSEMVEDARLSLAVSSARCRDRLPGGIEIVSVDEDSSAINASDSAAPASSTTPDSAAYVLYTSGSTGRPKAVVGIHRSVINGLVAVAYAPDEKCCLNALLSYGFSIANLFLPLMSGVPLVIISEQELKDIHALMNILERERITRIVLGPAVFKQILDLGPKTISKLRTIREIGLAGSSLTPDIITRFTEAMPLVKLHNCYSSSEIGTLATMWNVTAESIVRRETLIGRPVANTRIYILDKSMNAVPVGVAGEIYVGAAHLARGYLNQPDLTGERFLPDPFRAGARLYRTGDLGRFRPSGDIEYLGRVDDQVKIRGFRIELAEIEAALNAHSGVAQAVVVPRDSQNTGLAAYIVRKVESAVSSMELRRFLADRLPDFMIPASFTPIDSVPLLASGKVNRQALPEPSEQDLGNAPVPPSTTMEILLLEIWESVLGISNIGVCDSFFDLGGNSLQASALVAKIEERINRRVPATVLFKECTIRHLAEYLRREDRNPLGIVPIRIGSRPPLYVIHPQGTMRWLAPMIGSDYTIIGVEIPETESLGLQAMASKVARIIREFQPDPPYCLAGWCASGNLAYEVAQQMHREGTQVDLVILFEAFNFARTRRIQHWFQRVRWHCSQLRLTPIPEIRPYIRERLGRAASHVTVFAKFAKYRLSARLKDQSSSDRSSLVGSEALSAASYDYVPAPYSGEVVLFRPDSARSGLSHDPTLGWDAVAGKLQVIEVPGDHVTMFNPPNVDVLACKLAELLARYQRCDNAGSSNS